VGIFEGVSVFAASCADKRRLLLRGRVLGLRRIHAPLCRATFALFAVQLSN
jgi:hypothetical protein